jgi:hypothetical protein
MKWWLKVCRILYNDVIHIEIKMVRLGNWSSDKVRTNRRKCFS